MFTLSVAKGAAGESRTLTPLLTGALKAPVSAIPPPRLTLYSTQNELDIQAQKLIMQET